jgi:hypothetical protein
MAPPGKQAEQTRQHRRRPQSGRREPGCERQLASAISMITTDWNTCFSSATPASKRVKPLQNGSPFASSIKAVMVPAACNSAS